MISSKYPGVRGGWLASLADGHVSCWDLKFSQYQFCVYLFLGLPPDVSEELGESLLRKEEYAICVCVDIGVGAGWDKKRFRRAALYSLQKSVCIFPEGLLSYPTSGLLHKL
jgi:hypothetical protein